MVATQLNTFTPVGTAISIVAYMKKSWPVTGMPDRVHVVRPDDERQDRDRRGGVDHRRVAEQRLARERRDDLRDHAERGDGDDVHLGVAEEPEDVLVQHRVAAAGGVEEVGAEVAVGQRHGHRAGQHRHHRDQQVGGDQPGPAEQRHLHQRHAGRAHVEDGGDDVDRAHDRGHAEDVHREDRRGPCPCPAAMVSGGIHRPAHARRHRPARTATTISSDAAGGSSQKLQLFMRGNAMSGAPICIGISQFAKPTKAGMIAPNTMIRPCSVVIWLKNSGSHDLQARAGTARRGSPAP